MKKDTKIIAGIAATALLTGAGIVAVVKKQKARKQLNSWLDDDLLDEDDTTSYTDNDTDNDLSTDDNVDDVDDVDDVDIEDDTPYPYISNTDYDAEHDAFNTDTV